MKKSFIAPKDIVKKNVDDTSGVRLVRKEAFDSFNEFTLGLGDLSLESSPTNAMAVIFDLAGFTIFCKQIDPQLVVPDFLNTFLKWIFKMIRDKTIDETHPEGYTTWCDLPFYSKFLGDGILLLWDTTEMDQIEICNVIVLLIEICQSYTSEFLNSVTDTFVDTPTHLRCGVARGIVYNVGRGNDFVGPCINMAARLQKLGPFTFSFSRRGIDFKKNMDGDWLSLFMVIKCEIRGIGDDELICVLKTEYDKLDESAKKLFICFQTNEVLKESPKSEEIQMEKIDSNNPSV